MKIQQERRYLETHRLESKQKLVTEIDNKHIYHSEFGNAVISKISSCFVHIEFWRRCLDNFILINKSISWWSC